MKNQEYDPVYISDIFCKKHSETVAKIEHARLRKGQDLTEWPYWCFLPTVCWMNLFMEQYSRNFTRESWLEIEKLSVFGTWRYCKGIYTPHPALLHALTESPVSDTLPMDIFLRLPEWCIYVRTPGMFIEDNQLHGFWASVNTGITDNSKNLILLLNGQSGIKIELLPIKPGSICSILK